MKTIYLIQQECRVAHTNYYEQPTPLYAVQTKQQAIKEVQKLNAEQAKKDTTNDYCIFSYSWIPLTYYEEFQIKEVVK